VTRIEARIFFCQIRIEGITPTCTAVPFAGMPSIFPLRWNSPIVNQGAKISTKQSVLLPTVLLNIMVLWGLCGLSSLLICMKTGKSSALIYIAVRFARILMVVHK
jgi:hypothetical protein